MNFTKKMFLSLIGGLVVGMLMLFLKSNLEANTWSMINRLLFQDLTKDASAIGLFYIVGQLFIQALQLVIIPMVFTSITLAICNMDDLKKLGRISFKTIKWFFVLSVVALIFATIVGYSTYQMGLFNTTIQTSLEQATPTVAQNPLLIITGAMPSNLVQAFSNNGGVLAVVVLAVIVGLCIHTLNDRLQVIKQLIEDVNHIVHLFLNVIITKFAPIAVFALLVRTFAAYGTDYLIPAAMYMLVTTAALLFFLLVAYPIFIGIKTKLNPIHFMKKMAKVIVFAFSTSSSAASLPLNTQTTTEQLGVNSEIASFVLPLGMTINMNGTAIMQVIATIFIASVSKFNLSLPTLILIGSLALIASVGTPAAPGAGGIILFTILTGIGLNSEIAIACYTLILAINRPIEMLVTTLNVTGDSAVAVVVSHEEGELDTTIYQTKEKELV